MLKIEPSKLSLICKQIFKEIKPCQEAELNDIQHYQGFNELGRRVKRGEKSVYIQSDKTYPQPIFNKGGIIKDEQGKNVIRELKKGYSLFHVDQTTEVK